MYRQIGPPFGHRHFQLLDEQALAADRGQRPIENLITARGHAEDGDLRLRIAGCEAGADMLGLPQGKARFARSDH